MSLISKIYIILSSFLIFSFEQNTSQNYTNFTTMSYNVRYNNDTLRHGKNGSVLTRYPRVIKNIQNYLPDTIGFQEVSTHQWYPIIKTNLSENYNCIGEGRENDLSGEANPICYNKKKLTLIEYGTKWLSPTPDISGSQFEKSDTHPTDEIPRIFTYVIVKNIFNNITYMHINTHLDNYTNDTVNRISQINVIIDFIKKNEKNYSIILTGDFSSANTEKYKEERDVIPFLIENGFVLSSDEANDTDNHWTYVEVDYNNLIWDKCNIRGLHANNKNLSEQQECDEMCDEENGLVFDYCMRPEKSLIKFNKYKVISDFSELGGPSSNHYPIYVEGIVYNMTEKIEEEKEEEPDINDGIDNGENENNKNMNSEMLFTIFIGFGLIVIMVALGIVIFIKVTKKKDISVEEIKDDVDDIDNEKLVENGE